jgi:hypothetical protein
VDLAAKRCGRFMVEDLTEKLPDRQLAKPAMPSRLL